MPAPAFGSSRRSESVDRGSRWTPRPVASPRPLHRDLPRPADARGRRWREPGARAKRDAITRTGQSRGRRSVLTDGDLFSDSELDRSRLSISAAFACRGFATPIYLAPESGTF